jgi:hypothetical protein
MLIESLGPAVQQLVKEIYTIYNSSWTHQLREARLALQPQHLFFCLRGLFMCLTSAGPGLYKRGRYPRR